LIYRGGDLRESGGSTFARKGADRLRSEAKGTPSIQYENIEERDYSCEKVPVLHRGTIEIRLPGANCSYNTLIGSFPGGEKKNRSEKRQGG